MINWIIMIFYQLYTLGYLNLEQIFITNLLLLVIFRGIYVVSYYFNYYKNNHEEQTEGTKLFTKNEKIYFSIKQISLVLFGMIFYPITIYICFYSLLVSSNFIRQIGDNLRLKPVNIFGRIINVFAPLIGIIWFLFIEVDFYSIAAVGIGVLTFLHYGLKTSSLSLSKLIKKYDKRRLNKFPKAIQIVFIFLLIALPSTILSLSAVYAPPEKKTYMIEMRDGVKLATDVYFAPGSFGAQDLLLF